jgi:hypothetical protein
VPKIYCLDCQQLTTKNTSTPGRCRDCHNARRRAKGPRPYDNTEWRNQRRAVLTAWVNQHGWWCPGWTEAHPPHESHDLVVDHDAGPMCRSANGLKAATVDKTRAQRRREGGA